MEYTEKQLEELRTAIEELARIEVAEKKLSVQQLRVIFHILACCLPTEYIRPIDNCDHLSTTVPGWFVRDF